MKKKIALITGASRGIGQQISQKLVAEGFHVYAGYRSSQVEMKLDFYTPVYLDLTSESSIQHAVNFLFDKESQIDVLYHVAGEAYYCPVEKMSLEEVENLFQVNLFGPFRLTQLILSKMKKQNFGRIIFTSSVRALAPCEFMGMYGGSKAALENMAWDLYLTLKQWNIEVVVVEPGPVNSGIYIKNGSFNLDSEDYKFPEPENLEWQDLESAADFMTRVASMQNPPFRLHTSQFSREMVKGENNRFLKL